jgi:hypothetical protein
MFMATLTLLSATLADDCVGGDELVMNASASISTIFPEFGDNAADQPSMNNALLRSSGERHARSVFIARGPDRPALMDR